MSAVIAGFARSPFTRALKGELSVKRPDDIASEVINALIRDNNLNPELIEDLIVGTAFPEAEQGYNIARLLIFLTDLPETVSGVTINRFCGSSMQAIHDAAGRISLGAGDAFIAGGIESMSRIPMTGFNPMPNPKLIDVYPSAFTSMGITAENLAKKYDISRADQELFAIESHKKANSARESGNLSEEIIPITTDTEPIQEDGCIRPDTNQDSLSKLNPAFLENGSVTAGTSSPLTDGAAFVIVCSKKFAEENNLKIMAKITSTAVSGCLPEIMGIGPVEATKKALERADIKLHDVDVVELNEAFAAQSIAVINELGLDSSKVNIDGGAIAIGHPLGASGARITGKAAQILDRTESKVALATMCIGGGQGIATILEKP